MRPKGNRVQKAAERCLQLWAPSRIRDATDDEVFRAGQPMQQRLEGREERRIERNALLPAEFSQACVKLGIERETFHAAFMPRRLASLAIRRQRGVARIAAELRAPPG